MHSVKEILIPRRRLSRGATERWTESVRVVNWIKSWDLSPRSKVATVAEALIMAGISLHISNGRWPMWKQCYEDKYEDMKICSQDFISAHSHVKFNSFPNGQKNSGPFHSSNNTTMSFWDSVEFVFKSLTMCNKWVYKSTKIVCSVSTYKTMTYSGLRNIRCRLRDS